MVTVIVALPSLTAVTRPAASTVATDSSEDVHLTVGSVAEKGRTSSVNLKVSPIFSNLYVSVLILTL